MAASTPAGKSSILPSGSPRHGLQSKMSFALRRARNSWLCWLWSASKYIAGTSRIVEFSKACPKRNVKKGGNTTISNITRLSRQTWTNSL